MKILSQKFLFKGKITQPRKFRPSKYLGYMVFHNILWCGQLVFNLLPPNHLSETGMNLNIRLFDYNFEYANNHFKGNI